jgi:N-acetyl-alpha-D-muramate 1-phosphate uridylyltransferase
MNNNIFPVVILAGGLATRLRPLTENIPKALLDIEGEPFITHQLRLLSQHGIRKVVLCVGYLGEMLQNFVGDGNRFGMEVFYSFDGDKLLGTAGAIKKALLLLEEEHFFVLYGDSYLPCNYAAVQNSFIVQNKPALMTVFKNLGQWDTSNVEYTDNKIHVYDKKNRTENMQYIDYGLGVFNKHAFDQVSDKKPGDLALLYQELLKKNQLAACEIENRFYEIGSFAGIEELRYYLRENSNIN